MTITTLMLTCSLVQAQQASVQLRTWCNKAGPGQLVTGAEVDTKTNPAGTTYSGHVMGSKSTSVTINFGSCSQGTSVDSGYSCLVAPEIAMSGTNTAVAAMNKYGLWTGSLTYRGWAYIDNVQQDPSHPLEQAVPCPQPDPCPPAGCQTPVLIPLRQSNRGNQIPISDAANGVGFDINGTGVYRQTAWPINAAEVGFLAIDKNHSGIIDNGSELVGGALRAGSSNGFDALARLAPGKGYLKKGDGLFDQLVVWIDRNRDGVSTPDEIEPASNYLSTVYLFGEWVGKKDPNGNLYNWKGAVNYSDKPEDQRPVYDVTLAVTPPQE